MRLIAIFFIFSIEDLLTRRLYSKSGSSRDSLGWLRNTSRNRVLDHDDGSR